MKLIFKTLVLFLLSSKIIFAQVPAGYYDPANGLTGTQLQQALHDIIDGHIVQTYDALHVHFHVTDIKPNGKVWDMYSDIPNGTPPYEFNFGVTCGNYNSENDCYNREHSWPKSWFSDMSPMYSDLFHLYPTDGYVNGKRSNYPFGEVGVASWTSMNGSKLGSCSYPGYSGTVFEPIDDFKGDFARTYFYMSTRYYNEDAGWAGSPMTIGSQLQPWALEMMLKWSSQDPVSQKEIDRNNEVYKIQNNRNPFIDNPQYAFEIWAPESKLEVSLIDSLSISCGDSVILNPTIVYSDESLLSFSWSPVDGLNNPNIKNPVAKPNSTIVYTLTVTCQNICQAIDSTTIVVPNAIVFNTNFTVVTDTIINQPFTALFYNTTPNLSSNVYEWNFGDNTTSSSSNYAVAHEYAVAGSYSVSLKASFGGNCAETILKENCVHAIDTNLYVSLINLDSISCGETVTLSPNVTYSNENLLTFNWSPATGLSNPNIKNPIAQPDTTTTYTLTVNCPSGCQTTNTTTVKVLDYEHYNVNFTVITDTIVNKPYTALFNNTTPNIANYSFQWDFGDGELSTNSSASVVHEYVVFGDYTVKLTASNNTLCTETIVKEACVHVYNTSANLIENDNSLYKVFPNPVRDYLKIENNSKSSMNIQIINSIGQKVFENNSDKNIEIINTSNFENDGLYFVLIKNLSKNTADVKKVIFQKN